MISMHRAICGLISILLWLPVYAAKSPKAYQPPRAPDGHVDLEGTWKNSNLTPLERPKGFSTLVIGAQDAAKLKAEYLAPSAPDSNVPDDPGRVLEDRSFEPIGGEMRSSVIVDPEDGLLPGNEEFKQQTAALRAMTNTALDNPEQRPTLERCLLSIAAPPMQANTDGNYYQIVQTSGALAIMSEVINDVRIVRMNGTHGPAAVTSWLGDSIGWWEGNTLVVETKYFAPSSAVRRNSRYLYLVSPRTVVLERFTRVSPGELNYKFTVSDPTYYTRPWSGETHLLRTTDRIFEYACHEGNYSMRGILEAARASDAPSTH
jgi:hypothetical protein